MKKESFRMPKEIKAAEARIKFGEVIDTARYAPLDYISVENIV